MLKYVKPFLKTFLAIILTIAVCLALLILAIFIIFYENDEYEKATGWSCSNEEFADVYYAEYLAIVDTLWQKYGITCEKEIEEWHGENGALDGFTIEFHNDVAMVSITFNNHNSYGTFRIRLNYFGNDEAPFSDYESQRIYVEFINELTHSVAYDTRQEECANHFEKMFFENLQITDGHPASNYYYHFDDLVGSVGYVVVNDTFVDGSNKMQGDPDIDYPCSIFEFEGLLKPIENGD